MAAAVKQIVHYAGVFRVGGALEVIDLQTQHLPLSLELGGDDVAEFLGRLAGALGGALHIDAVLVAAGGEHRMVALHGLKPLNEIRHDGGVGVANVRRGIDVVDRSGEVIFGHLEFFR